MRHKFCNLVSLLFWLALFIVPLAYAEDLPAEQELRERIQLLQQRDPESNASLIAIYEEALRHLSDGVQYKAQAEEYKQVIRDFEELSSPIIEKIDGYQEPVYPEFDLWTESQLNQEIADRTRQLNDLNRRKRLQSQTLKQIENRISNFDGELSDLRFNLLSTEQDLARQYNLERYGPSQEARTINLQIKEETLSRHIQMLELEQLSAGERSELARLRTELISLHQDSLLGFINDLREEQRELRRAVSAKAVADSLSLDHPILQKTPRLVEEVKHNMYLTDVLEDIGHKQDRTVEQQSETEQSLTMLETSMDNFKEQVEWMKVSRAFAEDLRNRLKNLPEEPPLEELEYNIIQNRVDKYRFEQEYEQLKIDIKVPLPEFDIEQQEMMAAIYDARRSLLNNLLSRLDNLIFTQANLKLSFSKLDDTIRQIQSDAAEHMFWVANAEPINLNYPLELAESVTWLFQSSHLLEIPKAFVLMSDPDRVLYGLLFIALGYLAYLGQKHQPHMFKRWADKSRRITTDKLRYTFYALLFAYINALPIPHHSVCPGLDV